MSKQKAILVTTHMGRAGTSAMMGLLELAGLAVGERRAMSKATSMNPRGFFEIMEHQRFLVRHWYGFYPQATLPPPPEVVARVASEATPAYRELLTRLFGKQAPFALKVPRFLALPLFHELREHYDVRVLVMSRPLEDQIRSTIRVWTRPVEVDERRRAQANEVFLRVYLQAWQRFADGIAASVDFPKRPVDFKELLQDPAREMRQICQFCEIPCPEEPEIQRFLDRDLANRGELPATFLYRLRCFIWSVRQAARVFTQPVSASRW